MNKLIALTCCMEGNIPNVFPLRETIERLGYELRILSSGPDATHLWDEKTQLNEIDKADVILCVSHSNLDQPCKSSHRALTAMSRGKPVICSPLPSYKQCITSTQNGFIAETFEDWGIFLEKLKDPELRSSIGARAMETAKKYSPKEILTELTKDLTRFTENSRPTVDIIIPTWNNFQYLKTTIDSIRKNTPWPHTITVVNSGDYIPELSCVKVINSESRLHFSEAVNKGIQNSNNSFVAILNDDLIVAENWLNNLMFEAMKDNVGGVNPFSNCDLGWLHHEKISVKLQDGQKLELVPGMRLEQVQNFIPEIYKLSHSKEVTERKWLPYFCTVIPRHVINKVGLLDENFKSGCEDFNHSQKIISSGFKMLTTYDSVVFHFGGISRGKSQILDPVKHNEEDLENQRLMNLSSNIPLEVTKKEVIKKEVTKKLSIAIYTGPAWETWDLDTPTKIGIGGSETVVGHLAREFVKLGHKVNMYGEHRSVNQYDVNLHHYQYFKPETKYDLLIVSRNLDIITHNIKAKKVIAVAHDIWFQGAFKGNKLGTAQLDKIDRFIALSPWHKQFLFDHHQNIPNDKIEIISNYFDKTRYEIEKEKIPGRMIYASSLDRGLIILLHCWKWIKQEVPEATLKILYGMDGWEKALTQRGTTQEKEHYNRVINLIEETKNQGVQFVGKVNQQQLAEEFKEASLWAYPTFFSETFCLTALEAMASKTPIITTDLAALSSTVGDGGVLLKGDPASTEYCQKFVNEVVNVLKNKKYSDELISKGQLQFKNFDNNEIVKLWLRG